MTAKKKAHNPVEIAPVGMNLGQMEQLLSFMKEHGLEEFEYSQGDLHIRLKRAASHSNSDSNVAPRILVPPEIVVAAPSPASQASGETPPAPMTPPREPAAEPARAEDQHIVKSPIVGTYYGSPSPGAGPFVKLGDSVDTGQVLCIIEAMKLMNEIESDAAGEIMRIFVENGQPVEYGEPLFAIRPTRKK
jgi:acetyl-CoA carboxylase biotin carboxyl carrier protein